jgi:hypothetical protein
MQARLAVDHNLISPDADELSALRDALRILQDLPDDLVQLDVPHGTSVQIPVSAVHAMRHVIDVLANGSAVAITQVGRRLTLGQVATLLNLPLSHVTRIIDNGELAVSHDAGIPGVALDNLLTFVNARAAQRREALNELTRLSEELGLYDLEE